LNCGGNAAFGQKLATIGFEFFTNSASFLFDLI